MHLGLCLQMRRSLLPSFFPPTPTLEQSQLLSSEVPGSDQAQRMLGAREPAGCSNLHCPPDLDFPTAPVLFQRKKKFQKRKETFKGQLHLTLGYGDEVNSWSLSVIAAAFLHNV